MAALAEKRYIGTSSLYQEICKSQYRERDNSKYLFASLPGAAAFLYIRSSFVVVFFGMMVLALQMLMGERVVEVQTQNPLLSALFGLTGANTIAQFGLAPLQSGPYFLMWAGGIANTFCFSREAPWLDTLIAV